MYVLIDFVQLIMVQSMYLYTGHRTLYENINGFKNLWRLPGMWDLCVRPDLASHAHSSAANMKRLKGSRLTWEDTRNIRLQLASHTQPFFGGKYWKVHGFNLRYQEYQICVLCLLLCIIYTSLLLWVKEVMIDLSVTKSIWHASPCTEAFSYWSIPLHCYNDAS